MRQVVVVDQLRVAKNPRLLPEQLLDQLPVLLHLRPELLARVEKRQRMVIRLGEELDAAGLVQLVKQLQHVRRILTELLEDHAGKAEGNTKTAVELANVIEQDLRR